MVMAQLEFLVVIRLLEIVANGFSICGRGDVNFEEIIVALNDIQYAGPLSIEWEDGRMDRFHGATESCDFVRALDFKPNEMAFDSAFDKKNQ